MRFAAILFDLDGTLVETIELYRRACVDAFLSEGLLLSHDTFADYYSRGWSLEEWKVALGGADNDATLIRAKRDERYTELLAKESTYIPGGVTVLDSTTHVPRAIITGSWNNYVDAIDQRLSIRAHIPTIITSDDMGEYQKPHPFGLQLACEKLGVHPEDCLMIGDQTFDIDAANAIGMTSCLVWHHHTPSHAEGKADIECERIEEVMKHLY